MTERDDKWDPSGKGDGSVRDRIESYRSVVDSSARRFVTPAEKMRTMAREIFDKIDVSRHDIADIWVAFSPSGWHSSQDGSDIVVTGGQLRLADGGRACAADA